MKSLKVWIMTRRAGYNFGSSLQAYAMTYVINKLGFKNEIINYEEYRIFGKIRLMCFTVAALLLKSTSYIWKKIIPCSYKKTLDFYYQRKKFDDFEKRYFPLTSCKYKSSEKLAEASRDCDILICGSDQIWSPIHFCSAMFLDFASSKIKTIAYAPSIGVAQIESKREEIKQLVQRIDYLSIREEQGSKIIKELTGKDALVVLDPTLLLEAEEWNQIATSSFQPQSYILSYFLETDCVPFTFIENLRTKTGLRVINLLTNYSHTVLLNADNIGTVSPSEFLGLVRDAAFICTNSFHGTIFSIQFKKIFYVFERFNFDSKINQNSRIETLLSSMGLEDRIAFSNQTSIDFSKKINYDDVYMNLRQLRENSLMFLENSLHGSK